MYILYGKSSHKHTLDPTLAAPLCSRDYCSPVQSDVHEISMLAMDKRRNKRDLQWLMHTIFKLAFASNALGGTVQKHFKKSGSTSPMF